MRKPLPYQNEIPVAAHRGIAKFYPENTMASFRAAADLQVDMVETDVHITKDGHLVLMHDHTVDRTTNGSGLVRDLTLPELLALDAGSWKNEIFRGTKIPTLVEFLDFFQAYPNMLFNIELKDYPADCGRLAYYAADEVIKMLIKFGVLERCVLNTWSGQLNEYLDKKYGKKVKIHAYFPQEIMGGKQKRFVYDYAYCICLFGPKEAPVVEKKYFDFAKSYCVEPWVYYSNDSEELIEKAVANGAKLFTSNDPAFVMNILRQKGLRQ